MVLLYGVGVAVGYTALVLVFGWAWTYAIARKRQTRVAVLAELFDPGTARIDGMTDVKGYFYLPSISGLFHGRPAGFAVVRGDVIRVSVAGRFVLPFQVRAKHFSKLGIMRGFLPVLWIAYFLLAWPVLEIFGRAAFVKFAAVPLAASVVLLTVWKFRGKIGDVEFPKETRATVSFPRSESLVFSTDFPAEFHAIVDRADIQALIVRLVERHGVDHLRTIPIPFKFKPFDSKAEANFFYRGKLFDPAYVRDLLTDLLILCERIESPGQATEPASVAVTEPA
jgi:hypothetical protein